MKTLETQTETHTVAVYGWNMAVKYITLPARRDRNGRTVTPASRMESMNGSLAECRAALDREGFTAISNEAYRS